MPDISLTIDFLRQKYYYIKPTERYMPKCINGGYALWKQERKFILIVKVREIKVVVYISITFVSLFLKKGCVI